MADGFIAGLLVAFFGSAVGALLGQFLSFYRQSISDIENVVNILHLIESMDAEAVNWTANNPNAPVWQLRDKLYTAVVSSQGLLSNEANTEINSILSTFDKIQANTPKSVPTENFIHTDSVNSLNHHAESALQKTERIGWWECTRLFFLPNR